MGIIENVDEVIPYLTEWVSSVQFNNTIIVAGKNTWSCQAMSVSIGNCQEKQNQSYSTYHLEGAMDAPLGVLPQFRRFHLDPPGLQVSPHFGRITQ